MRIDDITTEIYQGDDTNAFGRNFIKVNVPKGVEPNLITKCIFQCGDLQKTYNSPKFPFYINFSSEESKKLDYQNVCYIQLFDSEDRKITLRGNLQVIANKQAIKDCSCETGVHHYVRK